MSKDDKVEILKLIKFTSTFINIKHATCVYATLKLFYNLCVKRNGLL